MTMNSTPEAVELNRLRESLTPAGRNLILATVSMCTVVPIMAMTTVNVVFATAAGRPFRHPRPNLVGDHALCGGSGGGHTRWRMGWSRGLGGNK